MLFDRPFLLFSFFLSSFLSFFLFSKLLLPSLLLSLVPQDARASENLRPGTSSRSIVFIPFLRSLPLPGGMPPLDERRHSRELIEPFHSTRRLTIEPFQSFQRPLVVRARVFIQKKKERKNQATIEGTIEVSPRRSWNNERYLEKAGTEIHPSIYFPSLELEKRTDP